MDSSRQVLRWSIPGFGFVTSILIFYIARVKIVHQTNPWESIGRITMPGVTAFIFGAIPIGFIIYQFYYASYRSQDRFLGFTLFLRADRGSIALTEYLRLGGKFSTLERVDMAARGDELKRRIETSRDHVVPRGFLRILQLDGHICGSNSNTGWRHCAPCSKKYESDFVQNWRLFQTLLDLTSAHREFEDIKAEYTCGSDLYHALGASRRAVSLAALLTLGLEALSRLPWTSPALSLTGFERSVPLWDILVVSAWALLWGALTRCRRSTDANFQRRVPAFLALISTEFPEALWMIAARPTTPPAHAR